jgi:hypothetical protein
MADQHTLHFGMTRRLDVEVIGNRIAVSVVDFHRGTQIARMELSPAQADLLAGHLTGAVTEIINSQHAKVAA